MQHLFVGLTKSDMAAVKQFKLKALALLLVYIVKATNQSARALCHQFLSQVDEINKYFLLNKLILIMKSKLFVIIRQLTIQVFN